jgi:hypothetical protein
MKQFIQRTITFQQDVSKGFRAFTSLADVLMEADAIYHFIVREDLGKAHEKKWKSTVNFVGYVMELAKDTLRGEEVAMKTIMEKFGGGKGLDPSLKKEAQKAMSKGSKLLGGQNQVQYPMPLLPPSVMNMPFPSPRPMWDPPMGPNSKCFKCGHEGHYAKFCPRMKGPRRGGRGRGRG